MTDEAEQPVTEDEAPEATEAVDDATFPASVVRDLRRENAKYRTELKEAKAVVEEANRSAMSEAERKDADLATAAERIGQMENELFSLRVRAVASTMMNDPADAAAFLTDLPRDADEQAIANAVTALLESKPYLAKQAAPSISQGERGGNAAPPSADDWLRETIRQR